MASPPTRRPSRSLRRRGRSSSRFPVPFRKSPRSRRRCPPARPPPSSSAASPANERRSDPPSFRSRESQPDERRDETSPRPHPSRAARGGKHPHHARGGLRTLADNGRTARWERGG